MMVQRLFSHRNKRKNEEKACLCREIDRPAMKTRPSRSVLAVLLMAVVATFGCVHVASGIDMATEPVKGVWYNDVPAVADKDPTYPSNADVATIEWGTAQSSGQWNRSGYTFDGNDALTTITPGVQFEVGTFTHNNWRITGDSITQVDLEITLYFADSSIGEVPATFTFSHHETTNFPDSNYTYAPECDRYTRCCQSCDYNVSENNECNGCADRVTFSLSSVPVQIGNASCTLQLYFPSTEFYTEENKDNITQLYGILTCQIIDLSLEKTVDNPTPYVGSDVDFTITVSNDAGYSTATDVTVDDLLPSGYTHKSHSGDGTYDDGSGVWTIGTIPSPGSATLTITATVNATGIYENYAEVETATGLDIDSIPGNNSFDEDDDDTAITTPIPVADLRLEKTVDTAITYPGESVTFTITLTNDGPSTATNVAVEDILPAGLDYLSSIPSPGSYDDGSGIWTVGTLGVGASATLEITAEANGTVMGAIENIAQVNASDQQDPDSTPDNNVPSEDDQDSAIVTVSEISCANYVITFDGSSYNDVTDKTVFTYTVFSNADPAVSHWILGEINKRRGRRCCSWTVHCRWRYRHVDLYGDERWQCAT